jgi:hypothetical protein
VVNSVEVARKAFDEWMNGTGKGNERRCDRRHNSSKQRSSGDAQRHGEHGVGNWSRALDVEVDECDGTVERVVRSRAAALGP